jgi:hypothetical protein
LTRNRLPRRDYVLLPGLSLLTILVLLCCAELTARHFFPDPEPDTCFYRSSTGPRERANCISFERVPESPRIQNLFDACGFRSVHGCGPKQAGVPRIAVLGSSVAAARLVAIERSYMALGAARYDFIPVAEPLSSPVHSLLQMDEVLALHPDAVIQVLSPIDVESLWMYVRDGQPVAANKAAADLARRDWNHYLRAAQDTVKNSRAVLAAEHFLFADDDTFLRLYLLYGYKAGFLRPPFSQPWRQRFAELDKVDGDIADRLRKARVPFYITAAPSRADAVLLHKSGAAYAWGREVERIAERHGAHYIDLLHAFAATRNPGACFYPVDGHMNAAAQPILAAAFERALDETTAKLH